MANDRRQVAEYAVEHEMEMRLVAPDAGPLASVWRYRTDDPWAVRVEFVCGSADPVPWVFSRELLARGVYAPAGLGDVQVFPYRGRVAIGLEGDEGSILMTARRVDLVGFLHAIFRVVPRGREAEHLDVDAVLTRVLEEAERC